MTRCKVKIKWIDGEWSEQDMFLSEAKKGWGSLTSHRQFLEGLKMATEWQVIQGEEILDEKNTVPKEQPKQEDLKAKAKELYEEHKSYAAVAKLIGKHPTTVRTWCNESV